MNFIDKTCNEFTELLASKAPVPGGGGAAALTGAIGAALGGMVAALTVGKKKYADVEAYMYELIEKANALRNDLLILVDKDAEVFEPLARAYGMPEETEEQKYRKQEMMEDCLKLAGNVPLQIMEKCCEAIVLQKEFADKGSRLAVSDAGVGAALCKAALKGAALNVYINTKGMKDREYAAELNDKADKMIAEYSALADNIFDGVCRELTK